MNLFFVTADIEMSHVLLANRSGLDCRFVMRPDIETSAKARDEVRTLVLTPPRDGRITRDAVYFATNKQVFDALAELSAREDRIGMVKMVRRSSQLPLLEGLGLPPRVGYVHGRDPAFVPILDQLRNVPADSILRLAIINVYGGAFGDAIVSLTALRELRRHLCSRFAGVRITVFQAPTKLEAERVYLASRQVDRIVHLPASLQTLSNHDAFIDLASDPLPGVRPVVDELLDALGIESRKVPTTRKRNRVPLSPATRNTLAAVTLGQGSSRPVLFLHPTASTTLRTMPDRLVRRILDVLLEKTDWIVWSAAALPVQSPRILNWTHWCTTFERLCALVARADMIVSTDTCVYHIADAFDVPGVTLFVAKPPGHWAAYYPTIDAMALGGDANPLRALDRTGSVEDLAHASRLWDALDPNDVVERLVRLATTRGITGHSHSHSRVAHET